MSATAETERADALRRIWLEVVDADVVRPDDDFFDLGGSSIDAVRLIGRVRKELGLAANVKDFFARPTLAGMIALPPLAADAAPVPDAASSGAAAPASCPVNWNQRARLRRTAYAETHGDGDWNALSHVIRIDLSVEGNVDAEALAHAVTAVGQRHDALRATVRFDCHDAEVLLRRAPPALELLTPEEAPAFAASALDLRAGPLARFGLVVDCGRATRLIVLVEHLIADGWSVNVLMRDLSAAYDAARRGQPAFAGPRPAQFHDLHREETAWLDGAEARRARSYWHERLADRGPWPAVRLRGAAPAVSEEGLRKSVWHQAMLDAAATEALRDRARSWGMTLYPLIAWALAAAVHGRGGDARTGIITPAANRRAAEHDVVVAWQNNMFILLQELASGEPIGDQVRRAHERFVEALDHGAYPMHLLAAELAPELRGRPRVHPCLYLDVGASHHHAPRLEGATLRPLPSDAGGVQPGVATWAEDRVDTIDLSLAHPLGFLTADEGERLLDALVTALRQLASDPASTLAAPSA